MSKVTDSKPEDRNKEVYQIPYNHSASSKGPREDTHLVPRAMKTLHLGQSSETKLPQYLTAATESATL